ncbi:hypothetical protein MASSI9I_20181 [Massilia sp. 9I]|nr:hypothetical protein MASSI9I_20181 [Massilia sp. 9I]
MGFLPSKLKIFDFFGEFACVQLTLG